VIAERAIRITPLEDGLILEEFQLRSRAYRPVGLQCPLRVDTAMTFDGRTTVLLQGLPRGWTAEDGAIEVDGKIRVTRRGPYDVPRPSEELEWSGSFPDGGVFGKHKIVVGVTLVSPRGRRIRRQEERVIEVLPEKAFEDIVPKLVEPKDVGGKDDPPKEKR
jgi:hypothetical protein